MPFAIVMCSFAQRVEIWAVMRRSRMGHKSCVPCEMSSVYAGAEHRAEFHLQPSKTGLSTTKRWFPQCFYGFSRSEVPFPVHSATFGVSGGRRIGNGGPGARVATPAVDPRPRLEKAR